MKKIVILFLVLFLAGSSVFAARKKEKPYKLIMDLESGSRTSSIDDELEFDDYIDVSAEEIDRTYNYKIYNVGVKHKTSNTGLLSVNFKKNEKEYKYYSGTGDKYDNVFKTWSAYYRFKAQNNVTCKLETYLKKKIYPEMDEDSKWKSGAVSFTITPKNSNFFFTSSKNQYYIKAGLKKIEYTEKLDRNSSTRLFIFKWQVKFKDNLKMETRLRSSNKDFDMPTQSRQNSTNNSYKIKIEYDFD